MISASYYKRAWKQGSWQGQKRLGTSGFAPGQMFVIALCGRSCPSATEGRCWAAKARASTPALRSHGRVFRRRPKQRAAFPRRRAGPPQTGDSGAAPPLWATPGRLRAAGCCFKKEVKVCAVVDGGVCSKANGHHGGVRARRRSRRFASFTPCKHGPLLPRRDLATKILRQGAKSERWEPLPPTESQNGRGWKGPLCITQSNTLPKQGHPEQAAQHLVQVGLEYLQRRRLHSLPGQPVPGLRLSSHRSPHPLLITAMKKALGQQSGGLGRAQSRGESPAPCPAPTGGFQTSAPSPAPTCFL